VEQPHVVDVLGLVHGDDLLRRRQVVGDHAVVHANRTLSSCIFSLMAQD
jgi:hypothetical protein